MRNILLLAAIATIAQPLWAQDGQRVLAHQADFDYLLGDWEFTSVSKEYGAGHGFWSALRFPDDEGGAIVLDEYRVVGDAGETYYVTRTLRAYNANLDRWELISTNGASGLQDFEGKTWSTGHLKIEARRIGPRRTLSPLAPARRRAP